MKLEAKGDLLSSFLMYSFLKGGFPMLQENISDFLDACKQNNFPEKSLESLSLRLREFDAFFPSTVLSHVSEIRYNHLLDFVSSGNASLHVKKQRVWAIRKFFHFLKLLGVISVNPAKELPYPKIKNKEPSFLCLDELKKILLFCLSRSESVEGLRNLVIIMMLGFLGLRLRALVRLNVWDVDLSESILWIRDKGSVTRSVPLPQILCVFLFSYLNRLGRNAGPLLLSKRKKRISERTLQHLFQSLMSRLNIDKHLHAHLFRHTAATQMNRMAGIDLTQALLGHRSRKSTEVYIHLNDCRFAQYMNAHIYHHREDGHA